MDRSQLLKAFSGLFLRAAGKTGLLYGRENTQEPRRWPGKNATSEDKIPQVEPSNANAFQRSTLSALKADGKHQYAAFGRF